MNKYFKTIYFFISILIIIIFIIMFLFNTFEEFTLNTKLLYMIAICSILGSNITSYIYLYMHRRKYILSKNDNKDKELSFVFKLNIYLLIIGLICMVFSFFILFDILLYVSMSLLFIPLINVLYIIDLYNKIFLEG